MQALDEWLGEAVFILGIGTTILEILGFVTGAICVYLNTRQNVIGWLFGIINACLYGLVFYKARLYADTALQGYYFVTSLYGWWMWLYGGSGRAELAVSQTPGRLYPVFAVIFLTATLGWGYGLQRFTDASLSYLDAALTMASLIGQWMMARKYLQNWLIWIVADVCYVAMFYYKELYLTAVLYLVFTVLAISGYLQWKRSMHTAQPGDLERDALI